MINNNQEKINEKRLKYVTIQLFATSGFILALLISFSLAYNKKLSLENKEKIFSDEEAQNLAIFQNILVFIVALSFLYINYKQYEIAKEIHDNEAQDFFLQIETSLFAIISSIIGLFIVFKNYYKGSVTIPESEIT